MYRTRFSRSLQKTHLEVRPRLPFGSMTPLWVTRALQNGLLHLESPTIIFSLAVRSDIEPVVYNTRRKLDCQFLLSACAVLSRTFFLRLECFVRVHKQSQQVVKLNLCRSRCQCTGGLKLGVLVTFRLWSANWTVTGS